MQVSDEGKIGIALALLGLGGGGALFVLPHPYADYVGWTLIGISILGLILLGLHHFKASIGGLGLWLRRGVKKMWPQYLMVASGILFFIGLVGFLQLNVTPPSTKQTEATTETPSLLSLFMALLKPKQGGTIFGFTEINLPDVQTRIYYNLFLDFNAQTKYISFYVTPQRDIIKTLSELDCADIVEQVGGAVQFNSHVLGGSTTINSKDYLFSGAAYIFHEDSISLEQIVDLTKKFKAKRCSVQFYSTEFKIIEWGAIRNGTLPKLPSFEIKNGFVQKVPS